MRSLRETTWSLWFADGQYAPYRAVLRLSFGHDKPITVAPLPKACSTHVRPIGCELSASVSAHRRAIDFPLGGPNSFPMRSLRSRLLALWVMLVLSGSATAYLLFESFQQSAQVRVARSEERAARACRDISDRFHLMLSGWI
jgi:hypothetical protein